MVGIMMVPPGVALIAGAAARGTEETTRPTGSRGVTSPFSSVTSDSVLSAPASL